MCYWIGTHPGRYDLGYDLRFKEFVRLFRHDNRIPTGCVRILSLKKHGLDYWAIKDENGLLLPEYWSLPRRIK